MPGNRAHSVSRQGPREASMVVADEHLFSKCGPTAKVTSMLRRAQLPPMRVPFGSQPTESARLDFFGDATRIASSRHAPRHGTKTGFLESGVYMPNLFPCGVATPIRQQL